ncbi:MAG: hypothetical protein KIG95_04435 [Comamonas sp.]|nr:hypothetical protein [Comamonas sp.]
MIFPLIFNAVSRLIGLKTIFMSHEPSAAGHGGILPFLSYFSSMMGFLSLALLSSNMQAGRDELASL